MAALTGSVAPNPWDVLMSAISGTKGSNRKFVLASYYFYWLELILIAYGEHHRIRDQMATLAAMAALGQAAIRSAQCRSGCDFETLELQEIVSFTALGKHRSRAVM